MWRKKALHLFGAGHLSYSFCVLVLFRQLVGEEGMEGVDVAQSGLAVGGFGEDTQDGLRAGEAADDEGIVFKINLAAVFVADLADGGAEVGEKLFDHDLFVNGGPCGAG